MREEAGLIPNTGVRSDLRKTPMAGPVLGRKRGAAFCPWCRCCTSWEGSSVSVDLPALLADLEELVTCESFSADHAGVARSAGVLARQGTRLLGAAPETILLDGVTHLRWTFGTPRVLLVGHHDTVWPPGSLKTHPWSLVDGIARGPGVFDMKAGLVQLFHGLASLPGLDGVCVLVTGDEEVGSVTSQKLVEESARGLSAAFVLEGAGDGGALKTGRKGVSWYEVRVHGKAAHSGLEPEKGVNAAVEAAEQILALRDLTTAASGAAAGGPGRDDRDADAAHGRHHEQHRRRRWRRCTWTCGRRAARRRSGWTG